MAHSGDSSGGEGAFGGYDGVDECNGDFSPIDEQLYIDWWSPPDRE
jgi:hypothetical protein